LEREGRRLLAAPSAGLAPEVALEVRRNANGLDHFGLATADARVRVAGDIGPFSGVVIGLPTDVEAQAGQAAMRVLALRHKDGRIVLIGRDTSERGYLLTIVSEVIAGSVVIILPGMLLIGAILSRGPIRRIRDFQIACRRIALGELDVRMPLAGRGDELDQVAATINAMIEDLERVVSQVKSVTDAVAHDLRTPLARVKSNLQELQGLWGDRGASSAHIATLGHDLDAVLERFTALLRISEIEASKRASRFQSVELGALVQTVAGLHAAVAEDAGIALSVKIDGTATIYADPQLILEALSNLMDNAIKFAGSSVAVSMQGDFEEVAVIITDNGPGIPAEEREAVLRRFYRIAQDNERPGMGLGLSVVTAILHLHKFRLILEDAQPGLRALVIAHSAAV
jgi:signal transduction histidine kinase